MALYWAGDMFLLAGAGIVDFFMPFALSWVSIPLPTAVAAVVAYRVLNLWLPLGPAVAGWTRVVGSARQSRAGA